MHSRFDFFHSILEYVANPKKMRFQLEQENRSQQTPNPISKVYDETGLRIQGFHSTNHKLVGDFLPSEYASRCFLFKGMVFSQVLQYTQTLNLFVLYSESPKPLQNKALNRSFPCLRHYAFTPHL